MTSQGQHALVAAQFGPRASAYLTSVVHAQGEDLEALAEIVKGHGDARVLDLGCGAGHVSFNIAPHVANVVAYDLSVDMLEAVGATARDRGLRNIETICGAAEQLPFGDATFDFVFTRFSAHHWSDLDACLHEARRVLRPGGRAAFVDVVAPESRVLDTFLQTVEMLRDPSHVRDYSRSEWERCLQNAGFEVVRTTFWRLRMDFAPWIERMKTPSSHVEAIRSLQGHASSEVTQFFEIESDGSFTFDTATFEATPA